MSALASSHMCALRSSSREVGGLFPCLVMLNWDRNNGKESFLFSAVSAGSLAPGKVRLSGVAARECETLVFISVPACWGLR